ncbi:MAG: hypothetical protein CFE21_02025 [Bacteroidetes bacterium B1(2017)]|nr:MAG: hypothetical protein CFE21_02025 [Bacteroidetes bacterium B1(2017)]
MKNMLKSVAALFAVLILASSGVKAQKFAYIDLQELMVLMPEYKKAATHMEAYNDTLKTASDMMVKEFQKKVADYQNAEKTMPASVKEMKQKDLQDMQNNIEGYQQKMQEDLRNKQEELIKPIIEKAKNAISAVAKEGGYSYVFDSSVAGLLYKPEGDNVMGKVKTKLGIL